LVRRARQGDFALTKTGKPPLGGGQDVVTTRRGGKREKEALLTKSHPSYGTSKRKVWAVKGSLVRKKTRGRAGILLWTNGRRA